MATAGTTTISKPPEVNLASKLLTEALSSQYARLTRNPVDMSGNMVHLPEEKTGHAGDAAQEANGQQSAVRFASMAEEIEPSHSLQESTSTTDERMSEQISPKDQEEIRSLAMTLQKSRLQQQRMTSFAFEPVSLPPSRVS
jgi:hypothetical protein